MGRKELRRWGRRATGVLPVIAAGLSIVSSGASAQTALPQIDVIAPTPLASTPRTKPSNAPASTTPGNRNGAQSGTPAPAAGSAGPGDLSAISRDKVPSNTAVMTTSDFNHEYTSSFLDAVNRSMPGVSLSDQTGNPYQKDLNYRGFTASPVQGTPQGIAIYQNGVRVNESWGDVVNWDFIPEKAIQSTTMMPSNPVFGLNAIGGAMSIQMKNGFTWHGTELEAMGGSYGRAQSSIQVGKQEGNFAFYGLVESAYDAGWRDFASQSHVNRTYLDFGARNDTTEFHLNFTAADDILGNVAATPLDMLNQRWSSVFTWPQDTRLKMTMLQANLTHDFSDHLAFQGNAYYRGFWQGHNDGNGTDAFPCNKKGKGVDDSKHGSSNFLCLDDGEFIQGTPGLMTNPTLNPVKNTGAFLGEIDRNWTSTNSFGGTAQLTSTHEVFGHENHLVFGASVDHGDTQFTASSELGVIDPSTLFVQGLGVFINNPGVDQMGNPTGGSALSTTMVHAQNTYTGFFLTDTFDVTNRLSITAGGRFNVAQINLQDETGVNPDLNASSQYQRFNPMVGATYKITPNITAYADYAEANRAPTPLELGCSSSTHPCMVDSFLVADPPLQQVVSRTIEGGLRGTWGKDIKTGLFTWGLGAFHTVNDNDIIEVGAASIDSPVANFGFFQNFGKTQRQGVEAKADYRQERWNVYANYTFVDATYQSSGTLLSPNNPNATVGDDDNLSVNVRPGDHIGGIPANRFKLGAEYNLTDQWKVGADLNVVGSQYLIHDDSNQFAKVPAYAVLNLHTSYQVTKNIEVFGLINNALNQHYYLAGTFTDTGGFTPANNKNSNTLGTLNDPRAFLPGMPFAAYGGVKVTF